MSGYASSTVAITLTEHSANTGRDTNVHAHGDTVQAKGDGKGKTHSGECISAQA